MVMIRMTHPDSHGVADVTEESFNDLWAEKGWVILDPNATQPTVAEQPPDEEPNEIQQEEE